jgi:hypothetical protein
MVSMMIDQNVRKNKMKCFQWAKWSCNKSLKFFSMRALIYKIASMSHSLREDSLVLESILSLIPRDYSLLMRNRSRYWRLNHSIWWKTTHYIKGRKDQVLQCLIMDVCQVEEALPYFAVSTLMNNLDHHLWTLIPILGINQCLAWGLRQLDLEATSTYFVNGKYLTQLIVRSKSYMLRS